MVPMTSIPLVPILAGLTLVLLSCQQPGRQALAGGAGGAGIGIESGPAIFRERGPFALTGWGTAMIDVMASDPLQGPYDPYLVLKVLDPKPSDTIADIGCGYGDHVRKLRAMLGPGGRVLGRDVREPSLEKARAKGVPEGCSFGLSNADDVLIPAGSLDSAYMTQVWGVVQHQPTRVALLESIHKALKPGAELIIVQYPNSTSDSQAFTQNLEAATRSAGFESGRRWQLWDPTSNRGPSWLFEFRRP